MLNLILSFPVKLISNGSSEESLGLSPSSFAVDETYRISYASENFTIDSLISCLDVRYFLFFNTWFFKCWFQEP